MFLYILLGLIVLFVIAAIAGSRDARQKGLNAGARIKIMEDKYENYVEKHIRNHILEANDLQVDPDQLAQDCLKVIIPDLDGLISLINSTTYSSVDMDYVAQYFPNLVSLTEDYFTKSQKNKSKRLSEIEVETFRKTALDAIHADVLTRLLDLKMGGL